MRNEISFTLENQVNSNANRVATFVDAKKDSKFLKLGEGAGIGFSFIEKEIIYFPKIEEAFPFTKKFRDTEILYISGFSETRKRFVEIPLATFRKRPAGEGELQEFYDEAERPLNCRLSEASCDLDRFQILCEVGCIQCTDIFEYHTWVFETGEDGKVHRTDKLKDLKVPAVKAVAEEEQPQDNATSNA